MFTSFSTYFSLDTHALVNLVLIGHMLWPISRNTHVLTFLNDDKWLKHRLFYDFIDQNPKIFFYLAWKSWKRIHKQLSIVQSNLIFLPINLGQSRQINGSLCHQKFTAVCLPSKGEWRQIIHDFLAYLIKNRLQDRNLRLSV